MSNLIMSKRYKESGFAHLLLLVLVVTALGATVVSTQIKVTEKFPDNNVQGVLLAKGGDNSGDDDQEESRSGSNNSGSSSNSGSSGSSGSSQDSLSNNESQKTSTPKEVERKKEETKKREQKAKPTEKPKSKTEIEIRKSETERVKIKAEDDKTKVEIRQGGVKIKYEFKDGELKVKAETEDGEELEDEELAEIENELHDELEDEGIEIATGSGKPVISKNKIKAQTDFPLSIDIATKQLIVTTPAGTKIVTVLPDKAVENLLANNIKINVINSEASSSAQVTNPEDIIKLELKDNEVVYKIRGKKTHKVLGFIPVETATTAFVSSETGSLIETEESVFAKVVDFLSP